MIKSLSPIPLPLLLERNARLFRNKAALMRWTEKGWARYTYAMLFTAVRRVAAFLTDAGLEPGERVGVAGGNSPEWVICFLGAQSAGGVAVPLVTGGGGQALAEAAGRAQCGFVFATDGLCRDLEDVLPLDRILSFQFSSRYDSLPAIARRFEESAQEPMDLDAPAAMVMVSRELETPTHRDLMARVNHFYGSGLYGRKDCFFSVRPLHDPVELILGNLLPLCIGATVGYEQAIEPADLFSDLRAVRPTVTLADRILLERLINLMAEGPGGVPFCAPGGRAFRAASARALNQLRRGLGGRLCYTRARKAMGLDALRFFVVTDGPPDPTVVETLRHLGFPLKDIQEHQPR